MEKDAPYLTVVNVTLKDCEDGGLEVFSDDLPGLILSGPDPDNVAAAIMPAIKALLQHRGFMVTIRPTVPVDSVLRSGGLLRQQLTEFRHYQFIVEFSVVGE